MTPCNAAILGAAIDCVGNPVPFLVLPFLGVWSGLHPSLGLFLCGKSGVIDVPGATCTPAGGTVCVPGDARTPILIWVPPPGGTICIPGDTSTPLVSLIWFHHRAEQSGTWATCAPIGWDSLGSTTGRNNLRLLSSLICVSWENCSPLVGFIWVPGAIRAPAGEIICILGENCSPVVGLIWVNLGSRS